MEGLVKGDMQEMKWGDVNGWVSQGGALLGEYFIFFSSIFPQCGNFMIFPSASFYVKSNLWILEVQNVPF